MNENKYTNSSEKLLHTNLMQLLGGKGIPKDIVIPPSEPSVFRDGGNNGKQPELVGSQVDEVLNHPPGWLLRWGTALFFSILLLILGVSWFVKYPDLVAAPMKILPDQLPKSILARSEGRLARLFVMDNEEVQAGELLAFIESTADYTDVLKLDSVVNAMVQKENVEEIYEISVPIFFNLGDLQKSYQTFQEAYTRSKSALHSGNFSKKKGVISGEIQSLKNLRSNTYGQLSLQEKDLQLALDEAESQKRLAEKGYVSALEAKRAMSTYLSKKQAYEQAKASLENNKINQGQKGYEILEIDKTIEEHNINLVQSLHSLKSDIEAWKQRYLAIAPTSGKVHFTTTLQENSQIKPGDEMMVVSSPSASYFGQMWVGQYNFGKIKTGQEVIVKFDSYPFQEFGSVIGKISYIGEMPKDSATRVNVVFPKGLKTNSNKNLTFKYGMQANAEIITEDMRLIERFFYDIRKSLKR